MYNKDMFALGNEASVIREIFEYGNRRRAEIGAENVFDFSLGNPSVPAPPQVNETIERHMRTDPSVALHGYTSGPGDNACRQAVADYLNRTYSTSFKKENVYMTCGAAASLCISFHALYEEGDEIIFFAPFFPEYRVFAEKAGYTVRALPCREEDLQIDLDALAAALNEHTKAVVINSPNNPSGVVVREEIITALSSLLREKSASFGRDIFLITDEPYRELVYDGVAVPYVTKYYDNTIVCYSFSKALSLPGERIGYVLVPDEAACSKEIFKAVCGAGRSLGYVCAPSLMQKILPECLGHFSDISIYKKNRDILLEALTSYGFECVRPDGAFYLFVRSPEKDASAFCKRAKKYELLLVPSDSFGFPSYVRISYCVDTAMIERSLPCFKKLAKEYDLA